MLPSRYQPPSFLHACFLLAIDRPLFCTHASFSLSTALFSARMLSSCYRPPSFLHAYFLLDIYRLIFCTYMLSSTLHSYFLITTFYHVSRLSAIFWDTFITIVALLCIGVRSRPTYIHWYWFRTSYLFASPHIHLCICITIVLYPCYLPFCCCLRSIHHRWSVNCL